MRTSTWDMHVVNGQQRLMISAIIRIRNFVFFHVYANFLQKRACSRAPMKLVMPAPPLCEGCLALLD